MWTPQRVQTRHVNVQNGTISLSHVPILPTPSINIFWKKKAVDPSTTVEETSIEKKLIDHLVKNIGVIWVQRRDFFVQPLQDQESSCIDQSFLCVCIALPYMKWYTVRIQLRFHDLLEGVSRIYPPRVVANHLRSASQFSSRDELRTTTLVSKLSFWKLFRLLSWRAAWYMILVVSTFRYAISTPMGNPGVIGT